MVTVFDRSPLPVHRLPLPHSKKTMGKILEINGPLVKLELPQTLIGEQVRVGRMGLVGEVIGRDGDTALAQLYEDTAGLRPGEAAEGLGWPLSVELGPGLLGAIFDGVQRPLHAVRERRDRKSVV